MIRMSVQTEGIYAIMKKVEIAIKRKMCFYIFDAIFLESFLKVYSFKKYCDSKQLNELRANDATVNHMYVLV